MSARTLLLPPLVCLLALAALGASCQKPPRLNGAGELDLGRGELASFEVGLACNAASPDKLEVAWGGREFLLTAKLGSFCRDDPALDPGAPAASFDTLAGGGPGTLDGEEGAYASFTFADAGEGGALPDYAEITITAPDGSIALEVGGVVQGNLEARGQPVLAEAPGEDPLDAFHSSVTDAGGRTWGYRFARLGPSSFVEEAQDPEPKPGGDPTEPPKIHPELAARVASGDPDERELVLMNLRDAETLRFFPDLWRYFGCDDPLSLLINPKIAAEVSVLLAKRELSVEAFLEGFQGGDHDVQLLQVFWLVNGFLADVRLGDVDALAGEDDLIFIEPAHLDVPPPMDDGNPANDLLAGRMLLNSDSFASQPGMDGGCIGLLDTGVRETHVLFSTPGADNLRTAVTDCDGGGPSCQDTSLPSFIPNDGYNHGTGSMSVLSGNAVYGPAFRGVTDVLVDSWKVYPTGGSPVTGIQPATVNGFQRALESMDRVIVAELQLDSPHTGMVATAADNAFDAGAVVVAAAGNCAVTDSCTQPTGMPRPETIRSPANAHKALGIGAYHLTSLQTPDYQSYGPTEDLRLKPELQAPTDAEAASQCGPQDSGGIGVRDCASPMAPDHSLLGYGGTSGSTPFAAGVAALVRNGLRKFGTWEPGHTYARMILKGDRVHPYDPRQGAGRLQLDTCTLNHWGKVNIVPNVQTLGNVPAVLIEIPVVTGWDRLEAAIWWPESATALHDDVDLYLVDPNGVEVAKGYHDTSVFERVEVENPVSGTWTVKIKSYTYLTAQRIYWTADLVGCTVALVPSDLPVPMPSP